MTATTTNIVVASLQDATKNSNLTGIYIKSISIAATHNPDLDCLLCITWSMPIADNPVDGLPGIKTTVIARPDDTYIHLPNGLYADQLEDIIIRSAWTLGAWDMCRLESPPIGSSDLVSNGVAHDFGQPSYTFGGYGIQRHVIHATHTMQYAAKNGRVSWRFIPLSLTSPEFISRWADKDKTLNNASCRDGYPSSYRAPWQLPNTPGFGNEHIYQLGRSNHGNRLKNSSERRGRYI